MFHALPPWNHIISNYGILTGVATTHIHLYKQPLGVSETYTPEQLVQAVRNLQTNIKGVRPHVLITGEEYDPLSNPGIRDVLNGLLDCNCDVAVKVTGEHYISLPNSFFLTIICHLKEGIKVHEHLEQHIDTFVYAVGDRDKLNEYGLPVNWHVPNEEYGPAIWVAPKSDHKYKKAEEICFTYGYTYLPCQENY